MTLGAAALLAAVLAAAAWRAARRSASRRREGSAPAPARPAATPFDVAVAHSKCLPTKNLSTEKQLELYAYYKQGSLGPCPVSKADAPSRADMVARAKWEAWTAVADIPQEAARETYVRLVQALDPKWDLQAALVAAAAAAAVAKAGEAASGAASKAAGGARSAASNDDEEFSEDEDDDDDSGGGGGGGGGMAVPVSRPAPVGEGLVGSASAAPRAGELYEAVQAGDAAGVEALLAAITSEGGGAGVAAAFGPANDAGETALHAAADAGDCGVLAALLGSCPPDALQARTAADMGGLTPLHYAVMQGHARAAQALVTAGADPLTPDADGASSIDLAATLSASDLDGDSEGVLGECGAVDGAGFAAALVAWAKARSSA